MISNKKIGASFESKALEYLKNKGFWATFLNAGRNGQPCDVVALKVIKTKTIGCLIDIKHCNSNYFRFSRIEMNQRDAFNYATKMGINCYFLIWFDLLNSWKWLDFETVKELEENGIHSWKSSAN